MLIKNFINKKEIKNKIFNFFYIIAIIFIFLVLFRLIIVQEFISTFKKLEKKIDSITNNKFTNNPIEKIRDIIGDAAKKPLDPEIIKELNTNLKKIYNDSIKPILRED